MKRVYIFFILLFFILPIVTATSPQIPKGYVCFEELGGNVSELEERQIFAWGNELCDYYEYPEECYSCIEESRANFYRLIILMVPIIIFLLFIYLTIEGIYYLIKRRFLINKRTVIIVFTLFITVIGLIFLYGYFSSFV